MSNFVVYYHNKSEIENAMQTVQNSFPVDAVITWVDGNDLIWREKFNKYTPNPIDWSNKKDSVRYNSIDEIELAILSIIKYAPFISNIYLVTDNQSPSCLEKVVSRGLKNGMHVKLIDHRVIFNEYEECLPCFNSCSIGSMLFRIPDLSEHFIIFNDDTLLMRDTEITDYFNEGKPIIRGRWNTYYEDKNFRKIYHNIKSTIGNPVKKNETGYKKAQQTSAKLLGFKKYVERDHTPVAIRKSTLEKYFLKNDVLRENVKHRFRHESQFIVSSFSNHLEVLSNDYHITSNLRLSYFQSYKNILGLWFKLFWFDVNKNKLFVCFQNLEIARKKELTLTLNWVSKKLD